MAQESLTQAYWSGMDAAGADRYELVERVAGCKWRAQVSCRETGTNCN